MKKKIFSILAISTLLLSMIAFPVSAEESDGYNNDLNLIGIDHDTYRSMPDSKKDLYKNMTFGESESITKYYKTEVRTPSNNRALYQNNDSGQVMVEITEEQYNYETAANIENSFISTMATSGSVNASWVKFTTTIAKSSTANQWGLSTNVTYLSNNTALCPVETHIAGLGCNSNVSVVSGSEFLIHEYILYMHDPYIWEPGKKLYYWNATKKTSSGYAFSFNISETQVSNKVNLGLLLTPNVSTVTLIDGFGHYAKNSKSFTPSISFSSGGASISISPTTNLITAPSAHVQISK